MDSDRTQRARTKREERLLSRARPLPGDSPEQVEAKKRRTKALREELLQRAWTAEGYPPRAPAPAPRPAVRRPVIRPDIHARFQAIVKRALETPD